MTIKNLCNELGYQFKNPQFLTLSLTHRSSSDENNERLEFLGDSIVNLIIAEALYQRFPDAKEGELTRWRATLINRDTLAKLGRHFKLGRYLILGQGEIKSGGSDRSSILSCAMEAVIGAIYLDDGFNVTRDAVLRWYAPLLDALSATSDKDPKTTLQEFLQRQRMPLPVYTVEVIEGEAHQQLFIVSCSIEGIPEKAIGKGSSRRRSEQEAAENMLGILQK